MLLRPSNLLLMDEPTNHLDLFSKDVLLDALRSFTGTVVFVSHDRHFIDGLATRVVEVEEGQLTSYHGDYEYYLAKKGATTPAVTASPVSPGGTTQASASGQAPAPAPLPPTPKEERLRSREDEKQRQKEERQRQKRLTELEKEIEREEHKLAELEREMNDPAFFADHEQARRAGEEHAALTARIAGLYGEWEAVQGGE
jgi:ATP-binding cassette subfamily F protein 3